MTTYEDSRPFWKQCSRCSRMVPGANPCASSGYPHCNFYGNGFTGGNMPCEYANMKGDCPKFTTEPTPHKPPRDIGEMMRESIK